MRTFTATAPSAWASYLINLDGSGLDQSEIDSANKWIAEYCDGIMPVSCEDAGFCWRPDSYAVYPFAADCQIYTFLLPCVKCHE